MAQPFDPERLRLTGELFPIAEHVGPISHVSFGAFSLSESGMLAYGTGAGTSSPLVWVDRAGKQLSPGAAPPGLYRNFRLAPDESRIVYDQTDPSGNSDLWVLDPVRGAPSRLTFDSAIDNLPLWSPDGKRILWPSNRTGSFDLYVKDANGTGQEEIAIKLGTPTGWATDWSADGKFILYQMPGAKTGQDLWIAAQPAGKDPQDAKAFPYLQSQFDEQDGRFSPDGHWIAYVSNESGRDEVYVRAFPLSAAKFQISTGGGAEPRWRKDGSELFYLMPDGTLMAVPVKMSGGLAPSFQSGLPKPLITVPPPPGGRSSYAVSGDGQRFLVRRASADDNAPALTVDLNWQSTVKN